MTEPARGIHDHPGRALGKRPPLEKRALMLRDILTGVVPDHPLTVDYLGNIPFGLYGNNRFGVCGPAAVANYRRLVTTLITDVPDFPTQDDVWDLYRRSGNPGFDPALYPDDPRQQDEGVYMHVMLDALHTGGIGGTRCVAFAKIDVDDRETLRAATAIFGGLLYGVDLQSAQQSQTDTGTWDYVPSGEWGGHAVPGGQYDQDSLRVVTWAELVDMTDRFVAEQADEAWVIVFDEHFGSRAFLQGVDLEALRQAYRALTGRDLPTPEPPEPPAPAPLSWWERFLAWLRGLFG